MFTKVINNLKVILTITKLYLRAELVRDDYVVCLVCALFDELYRGLFMLRLAGVSQWTVARAGSAVCYLALSFVG